MARLPGSTCSADTVDVFRRIGREIIIYDHVDSLSADHGRW